VADAVLFSIFKDTSGDHFEACNTTGVTSVREFEVLGAFVSWIFINDGICLYFFDNELEVLNGVVGRISDEGIDLNLWIQAEGGDDFLEVRDEQRGFSDISRFGDFMDGKFGEGIVDDVISVAPKVLDLFLGRRREGNDCTQSAIGIAFWYFCFIKAITGYCFEIILFNIG